MDIVLLDFGVARSVRIGARVSVAFGTPGYAPKEQIVDGRPEPRSDLYALAVCMYQLLTKKEPSEKPPPFPVPARNANRRVPQWLSDLIAINLNWDEPQERYESAAEMRKDLINRRVTSMRTCPKCGKKNKRSNIYCENEGCAFILCSSSRRCQSCSEFIPFNARFCPECGKKQF
jgi:serine/threonine protein kinase